MIRLDERVSLILFVKPCDMRRQMDSLMGMVQHALNRPARAGQIYIFMNRRRNTIRLLFMDSIGVCVFSKRLFKGSVGLKWAQGLALDAPVLEVSAAVLIELLSPTR